MEPVDRLLADVGGTNARFALQADAGAPITDIQTLRCSDFPTLADAIQAYLRGLNRPAPRLCAIAIATAVLGDSVKMTNHDWEFSISELQAQFEFETLRVINDFAALALAIPTLRSDEMRQVGGGIALQNAAIGLIGAGTGLGVSGLLPDGRGGWVPIDGEGGHVTLAARTQREQQVLEQLAAKYGHVSAERAVCGRGLVDLYAALASIDDPHQTHQPLTAAEITDMALIEDDPRSCEAIDLFCAFLGTTAGNLALTLGARGGVYVGGGIVPRFGLAFDRSSFRKRFEQKGRFTQYLAEIPVFVIEATQPPALRGAAFALNAS